MDIFDLQNNEKTMAPLAERMRPRTLDEFLGQGKIVGQGSLLRRAIAADKLGSCIFYGPPGTGKTTLANIIAENTNAAFVKLNAVTSGVADAKRLSTRRATDLECTASVHICFWTNVTAGTRRKATAFCRLSSKVILFLSALRRKIPTFP